MEQKTIPVAIHRLMVISLLLCCMLKHIRASAQVGAALKFDGLNDNVTVSYTLTNDFSIEFWMKTTSFGPGGPGEIWLNGRGLVNSRVSGTRYWGTSLIQDKVSFGLTTDIGAQTIYSTSPVNTGAWVHVAATREGVTGEIKLYVNGMMEASAVVSTATLNSPTIFIGRMGGFTSSSFFNGTIDEVRIWDRVLTAAEIASHKDCEISSPAGGLQVNYHFNQGIAGGANGGLASATDASGNNRNGTLLNLALTGTNSNWVAPGAVTSDVSCTGSIAVEGNGVNIVDSSLTPLVTNNSHLGSVAINTALSKSFTVKNTDDISPLTIDSIRIAGADASSFAISGGPATVAAGGSGTFTITFTGTALNSVYTGIAHVYSNASNIVDFDFAIRAETLPPTPTSALYFDGVDDYVSIPHPVSGDFTVEYWMKTTATGGTGPQWQSGFGIVDANVNTVLNDWGTTLVGSKLAFGIGNPDVTIFSTSNVNTGSWVHVAVSWKQTTGEMKLYINGVLESTGTGGTALRNAPPRITLGQLQPNANRFNGYLDELRIWNKVLNATEIQNYKNCEIAGSALGLLSNYHFNQGYAEIANTGIDTLSDASGNARTGSLNNFALNGTTSNWANPGAVTSGGSCVNRTIAVTGNGNTIADGQVGLSAANFTNMGTGSVNIPVTKSYTITNTGVTALTIDSIVLSGSSISGFTVTNSLSTIAPGASGSFSVSFLSGTAGVTQSGTVHVYNNSSNASDFDFPVQAKAIVASPASTLYFDGLDDYVSIPHPISGDFTVEYWMKTTATGPTGPQWQSGWGIVDANVTTVLNDWGTTLVGSKLAFGIGNPDMTIFSSSNVNTGDWTHIAVSWKQATGEMKLYVNGMLEASGTGSTQLRNAPPRITIGQLQPNANRFKGYVDELRIWSRVLTTAEIQAFKACEIASPALDLQANYHFNQGNSDVDNGTVGNLTDASGNNRTGTLNNLALAGSISNWADSGAVSSGTSCTGSIIFVQGNGNDISDEQTTTSLNDFTDMGSSLIYVPLTKIFTIQNRGVSALTIDSFALANGSASKFTLSGTPSVVGPGTSGTFNLSFMSITPGTYSDTIHLYTNSVNSSDFDFVIRGTDTCNFYHSFFVDNDHDGHGTGAATVQCARDAVTPPPGYALDSIDCNDNDASIFRFCCTVCVGTPAASNKPGKVKNITQSGNVAVCPGETRTFTIDSVARACYYVWTIPAGAAIVSGDSTHAVTVQFSSGFSVSGNISVFAQNGCGISASKSLTVKRGKGPAAPLAITGQAVICLGETHTYTIDSMTAVWPYVWSIPAGAFPVSGDSGRSFTIQFSNSFTSSGVISVAGKNNCGIGTAKSLTIKRGKAPAAPGVMTGQSVGLCSADTIAFSVPPMAGVSYTWSLMDPGIGSIANGQGSNAVNINFNDGWTTGTIKVTGSDACGTSAERKLTIKAAPANVTTMTGPSSLCPFDSAVYSIPPALGASVYIWTGPAGSTISDGVITATSTIFTAPALTTASSSVTVSLRQKGGQVKVVASNDCYDALPKSINVALCGAKNAGIEENYLVMELYPNPAHNEINLQFSSEITETYRLGIFDAIGKLVIDRLGTAEQGVNQQTLDIRHLVPGVYQLIIQGQNLDYKERFIVE